VWPNVTNDILVGSTQKHINLRPCWVDIPAEMDSIFVREGAGTDTVLVKCYF